MLINMARRSESKHPNTDDTETAGKTHETAKGLWTGLEQLREESCWRVAVGCLTCAVGGDTHHEEVAAFKGNTRPDIRGDGNIGVP